MDPIASRGFSQLPGRQFGVFLGTRGKLEVMPGALANKDEK